jgi:hypothetical protein
LTGGQKVASSNLAVPTILKTTAPGASNTAPGALFCRGGERSNGYLTPGSSGKPEHGPSEPFVNRLPAATSSRTASGSDVPQTSRIRPGTTVAVSCLSGSRRVCSPCCSWPLWPVCGPLQSTWWVPCRSCRSSPIPLWQPGHSGRVAGCVWRPPALSVPRCS